MRGAIHLSFDKPTYWSQWLICYPASKCGTDANLQKPRYTADIRT